MAVGKYNKTVCIENDNRAKVEQLEKAGKGKGGFSAFVNKRIREAKIKSGE